MPAYSVATPPDLSPCDPSTCYDESNWSFRMACRCTDWQGRPIPGCVPPPRDTPFQLFECRDASTGAVQSLPLEECRALGEPWHVASCSCYCPGGHAATQVAAPAGPTALRGLAIGDAVLAAHGVGDPAGTMDWRPTTVTFATTSQSPPGGAAPLMVNIGFGVDRSIIVHPGQLMLVAAGTLKRADRLVPGSDALIDRDGATLTVHAVTPGHYHGEIAYVATGDTDPADWDGTLDGHLLALDGVIVGDYLLELMADSDLLARHLSAPAPAPAPAVHAPMAGSALAATPPAPPPATPPATPPAPHATFAVLEGPSIVIPTTAVLLFSPVQEAAFAVPRVPVRPLTDQTNAASAQYFITLFSAFFPHVRVTLDWGSPRANVAAFATAKQPQVVIGGGFARLGPIYGEAIAVAIGFGIANRTIPSDATSIGHALYDGVGTILPQALRGGDLASTLSAALDQYMALFALVEPAAVTPAAGPAQAQGEALTSPATLAAPPIPAPIPAPIPLKPTLTLACFADVIDAAISGVDFPTCAS